MKLPTALKAAVADPAESGPGGGSVETVAPQLLPVDWIENPAATRAIGDGWLTSGRSLLLVIPSAIVPETFNVLVNPGHAGADRVRLAKVTEHTIDPRLLAL